MVGNRVYSTFAGSLLTVAIRWTDRFIGFISTIILARLLMAEDFGVIAQASLIIAFANVLLDFGVHVALIRDPRAEQAHFDTAWTIRLIQTAFSTVLLLLAAPYAADYFRDARVEPVIMFLALQPLLGGLENVGLIQFQKNMEFGAEFRFLFIRRAVGFVVTIVAAITLRSYWALVFGTLAGQSFGAVLSYVVHPMRPRLSLSKFGEIFSVSQWMLVANIGTYLRNSLHRLLVGRWASTDTMGAYSIADEISTMPGAELIAPINRALFPAFAKVKDDIVLLKEKLLLAQGVQTLIVVPVAVGFALVAPEAVLILLGERWTAAIDFVEILVLVSIAQSLTASGAHVLLVLGRIRANVIYVWLQVVVFFSLAMTFYFESDAIDVAELRLLVASAGIMALFWLLLRAIPVLRVRDIVGASIRPIIGAALMAAAIKPLTQYVEWSLFEMLALKIMVGAPVYVGAVMAMWLFSGKPSGAESYCLQKGVAILRARIRR